MTPLRVMDYCKVVSDKKLKGSGLQRGDRVLITSVKPVPAKKSDPYLQRLVVVVLKVEEEQVLVPKDGNEHKAYLVDPRNLEKVPEEERVKLEENLKLLYG